ncbi:hypothetical protein GQ457_04G007560 [Hibiscus cannabinus]
MASAPIVFLLSLSLVFFALVTSQTPPPPPPPSCSTLKILGLVTACVPNLGGSLLPINASTACCNALVGSGSVAAVCLCRALSLVGVKTDTTATVTNVVTACNAPISANFTCGA